MKAPDSGAAVHVAGQRWQVAPGEDDGLVERVMSAAEHGEVLAVQVVDGGAEGVLVIAPAVVPVVVTGARPRPPATGRPQY